MKNALIYTVIFAAIQVVVSFGVQGAYTLIYGPGAKIDAMGLIITMAVFSVAVIALFLLTKWAEVSRHWVRTRPAYASMGSALLVCFGCAGRHHPFYLASGADARVA